MQAGYSPTNAYGHQEYWRGVETDQDVLYTDTTISPTCRAAGPLRAAAKAGTDPPPTRWERLGRTIKRTEPNGNVTYTVYNDSNHEVATSSAGAARPNLPNARRSSAARIAPELI